MGAVNCFPYSLGLYDSEFICKRVCYLAGLAIQAVRDLPLTIPDEPGDCPPLACLASRPSIRVFTFPWKGATWSM